MRNTGSMLVGKNGHPNLLLSLPPKFLKKSLEKSLNREYLLPDFNIDNLKGVENDTEVASVIDVEIPAMLRPMIGGKLQEAAEKFNELILTICS